MEPHVEGRNHAEGIKRAVTRAVRVDGAEDYAPTGRI
jgi:hypothetical protein